MTLKKKVLSSLIGFFAILCVFNLVVVETSFREYFSKINGSIFEPVLLLSLTVMISAIIASFFSMGVFNRWYRSIFVWAVPISLVITFLTDSGISYGFISRTAMAMLLGEILILATLVFALVQKFYYKR